MRKIILIFLALFTVVPFAAVSCADKGDDSPFDVQFSVPEEVDVPYGSKEMKFRVMFGKAPLESDVVVLGDPSGKLHNCPITSVSSSSITIALYEGFVSGKYNVYIQREASKKLMGTMTVTITYNSGTGDSDIELETGTTVYGVVSCGSEPVKGVVVSDGFETALTNAKGEYQLRSSKHHGYVFMSVPSGYEAISEGVIPKIHASLSKSKSQAERVDFMLEKASGQDNHTMLVFGDLHLANRTSDAIQFADFTADVKEYIAANSGRKVYAMTLGDMTWDLYWYTNSYAIEEYLRDIRAVGNVQVFNTIGNHDHEMNKGLAGDFDTVTKYKKLVAPTYYSFNIGKVHYVVLDDIECKNTGAGDADSRKYDTSVVQEQLDWLKKDLSYVPKSTPLVIAMHAPLYNDSGNSSLKNAPQLEELVKGYSEVHIWTGHTHKMYNVDKLASENIFEHNAGAVCATWWWTGHFTPGIHVAQDGAPGGYSVVDVTGTQFEWQFKATDFDIDHQFRTYDRNSIALTASAFVASNASDANKQKFEDAAKDWISSSTDNYVYINVWNYDPEWKIVVKEGNASLDVERVTVKDPLHLIAYNGKSPSGGFGTSNTRHMFRVKAASATSTLEISVTDRFGNVYKETMKRPKAFSLEAYK